jgi:hypothetical protein
MQCTSGNINVLPPGVDQGVRAYHYGRLPVMQWTVHGVSGEHQPACPMALPEQRANSSDKHNTHKAQDAPFHRCSFLQLVGYDEYKPSKYRQLHLI